MGLSPLVSWVYIIARLARKVGRGFMLLMELKWYQLIHLAIFSFDGGFAHHFVVPHHAHPLPL